MSVFQSINPATGELVATFEGHTPQQVDAALDAAAATFRSWRRTSFEERGRLLRAAAQYLRSERERFARLITLEMGKPIRQARAEIEKCAWNCEFYAEHGPEFLADRPTPSDAQESVVVFDPLGVVLAIMPWTFPFWQVFRFAAPALMAGNTAVLKHAANVPQCALAIEEVFRAAGFPDGCFRTLLLPSSEVQSAIEDPRVAAVTLTGSDLAGSRVAEASGRALKKTVLELGGSDPFIVLADADLDAAARVGALARNQNTGQSCIAAKRFIVVEEVFEPFVERFVAEVARLRVGDPFDEETDVGPLARADLRTDLERQVGESMAKGATVLLGGYRLQRPGYFYAPTILSHVTPEMPVFVEETFGPVAAIVRAKDTEEAVALANRSVYGLGAALWTQDLDAARSLARELEAGCVFVNGMVASDPRLPFGGVKRSGYGRELGEWGIREFVNIKTLWVGPARQRSAPAE